MEKFNFDNFIPNIKGKIANRPGYKHIRWGRKTFLTRIKMWWNGDPLAVHQLLAFGDQLFAATDRGLYVLHNDVMKPVPCVVESDVP